MSVRKLSTASILSPSYKNSKIWDGETFPGYFESIQTVVVPSAGATSVVFNNIPQNYAHLQIRGIGRTTESDIGTNYLYCRFNNNNQSLYSFHNLTGNGANVSAGSEINNTLFFAGLLPRGNMTANVYGTTVIDILDYTNTNKNKTVRTLTGVDYNGTVGGQPGYMIFYSGLWRSTSAITSIQLIPEVINFSPNSHFALYGIRSA